MYVYADFIYDCISYFACQRKRIYLIRIKFRFFSLAYVALLTNLTYHLCSLPQQQTPLPPVHNHSPSSVNLLHRVTQHRLL
jgi:hypothetical protein